VLSNTSIGLEKKKSIVVNPEKKFNKGGIMNQETLEKKMKSLIRAADTKNPEVKVNTSDLRDVLEALVVYHDGIQELFEKTKMILDQEE
jgi:hypothetical protein